MYIEIRKIAETRHLITFDIVELIANAIVLLEFDYCNSPFQDDPNDKFKITKVRQNNAAGVIVKKIKCLSTTVILMKLHWISVENRII